MLKKLLLVFICVSASPLFAHTGGIVFFGGGNWTPINIMAVPVISLVAPDNTDVYGLFFAPGFGWCESVYGVNLGIATLTMKKSYGVSAAVGSLIRENNGAAIGIFHMDYDNNGLAAGIFNLGVRNNRVKLGIVNLFEDNAGICIGVLNCKAFPQKAEALSGTSVGIVNISKKNTFQLGIYNQAQGGLQIGLLNHNPNALIPWMPFFNWSTPNTSPKKVKIIELSK